MISCCISVGQNSFDRDLNVNHFDFHYIYSISWRSSVKRLSALLSKPKFGTRSQMESSIWRKRRHSSANLWVNGCHRINRAGTFELISTSFHQQRRERICAPSIYAGVQKSGRALPGETAALSGCVPCLILLIRRPVAEDRRTGCQSSAPSIPRHPLYVYARPIYLRARLLSLNSQVSHPKSYFSDGLTTIVSKDLPASLSIFSAPNGDGGSTKLFFRRRQLNENPARGKRRRCCWAKVGWAKILPPRSSIDTFLRHWQQRKTWRGGKGFTTAIDWHGDATERLLGENFEVS